MLNALGLGFNYIDQSVVGRLHFAYFYGLVYSGVLHWLLLFFFERVIRRNRMTKQVEAIALEELPPPEEAHLRDPDVVAEEQRPRQPVLELDGSSGQGPKTGLEIYRTFSSAMLHPGESISSGAAEPQLAVGLGAVVENKGKAPPASTAIADGAAAARGDRIRSSAGQKDQPGKQAENDGLGVVTDGNTTGDNKDHAAAGTTDTAISADKLVTNFQIKSLGEAAGNDRVADHLLAAEFAIDLRGVRKRFMVEGGKKPMWATKGVTLGIPAGECFGLLGPNGAGKTTLFNMMSGNDDVGPPTTGKILVFRRDAAADAFTFARTLTGIAPQFDKLWPRVSARTHLRFYSRISGMYDPPTAADEEARQQRRKAFLSLEMSKKPSKNKKRVKTRKRMQDVLAASAREEGNQTVLLGRDKELQPGGGDPPGGSSAFASTTSSKRIGLAASSEQTTKAAKRERVLASVEKKKNQQDNVADKSVKFYNGASASPPGKEDDLSTSEDSAETATSSEEEDEGSFDATTSNMESNLGTSATGAASSSYFSFSSTKKDQQTKSSKNPPADFGEARIERFLRDVSLSPEDADRASGEYSGGMKRKLSVALTLITDPHVVFLDEMSAGVDIVAQRSLWNKLINRPRGQTVITTTHSMMEADATCDRVGILVAGRLQCLGETLHIKNQYGNGYHLELNLNLQPTAEERAVAEFVRSGRVLSAKDQETLLAYPASAMQMPSMRDLRRAGGAGGHQKHRDLQSSTPRTKFAETSTSSSQKRSSENYKRSVADDVALGPNIPERSTRSHILSLLGREDEDREELGIAKDATSNEENKINLALILPAPRRGSISTSSPGRPGAVSTSHLQPPTLTQQIRASLNRDIEVKSRQQGTTTSREQDEFLRVSRPEDAQARKEVAALEAIVQGEQGELKHLHPERQEISSAGAAAATMMSLFRDSASQDDEYHVGQEQAINHSEEVGGRAIQQLVSVDHLPEDNYGEGSSNSESKRGHEDLHQRTRKVNSGSGTKKTTRQVVGPEGERFQSELHLDEGEEEGEEDRSLDPFFPADKSEIVPPRSTLSFIDTSITGGRGTSSTRNLASRQPRRGPNKDRREQKHFSTVLGPHGFPMLVAHPEPTSREVLRAHSTVDMMPRGSKSSTSSEVEVGEGRSPRLTMLNFSHHRQPRDLQQVNASDVGAGSGRNEIEMIRRPQGDHEKMNDEDTEVALSLHASSSIASSEDSESSDGLTAAHDVSRHLLYYNEPTNEPGNVGRTVQHEHIGESTTTPRPPAAFNRTPGDVPVAVDEVGGSAQRRRRSAPANDDMAASAESVTTSTSVKNNNKTVAHHQMMQSSILKDIEKHEININQDEEQKDETFIGRRSSTGRSLLSRLQITGDRIEEEGVTPPFLEQASAGTRTTGREQVVRSSGQQVGHGETTREDVTMENVQQKIIQSLITAQVIPNDEDLQVLEAIPFGVHKMRLVLGFSKPNDRDNSEASLLREDYSRITSASMAIGGSTIVAGVPAGLPERSTTTTSGTTGDVAVESGRNYNTVRDREQRSSTFLAAPESGSLSSVGGSKRSPLPSGAGGRSGSSEEQKGGTSAAPHQDEFLESEQVVIPPRGGPSSSGSGTTTRGSSRRDKNKVKLASLFRWCIEDPLQIIEDYALGEPTMEQVFLKFAKEQEILEQREQKNLEQQQAAGKSKTKAGEEGKDARG
ncbi:unnamed protein product [Amoebophrya sp. A120]|nr:unnamed protein product [Amoebophrya sp. A120]|eukprot:GSA120T00000230001.1